MGVIIDTTDKFQRCIDVCNKCAQACLECFTACLNEPDLGDRKSCVHTLIECSKMCEMSSWLMSINSELALQHCNLCAEICEKCANECDMHQDDHCPKCARICRECASECKKMGNM